MDAPCPSIQINISDQARATEKALHPAHGVFASQLNNTTPSPSGFSAKHDYQWLGDQLPKGLVNERLLIHMWLTKLFVVVSLPDKRGIRPQGSLNLWCCNTLLAQASIRSCMIATCFPPTVGALPLHKQSASLLACHCQSPSSATWQG